MSRLSSIYCHLSSIDCQLSSVSNQLAALPTRQHVRCVAHLLHSSEILCCCMRTRLVVHRVCSPVDTWRLDRLLSRAVWLLLVACCHGGRRWWLRFAIHDHRVYFIEVAVTNFQAAIDWRQLRCLTEEAHQLLSFDSRNCISALASGGMVARSGWCHSNKRL